MARDIRAASAAALLYGLAALAGVVTAAVLVLNLHILVGLEEGYAASPADVLDRSWVLAVVDLALLVSAPVSAVALVARGRRHRKP